MTDIDIARDVLPLKNTNGFSRDIKIDSCPVDDNHYQVRGQLTDTRADYDDPNKIYIVHCIVANITIRVSDNIITDAEFGLPKMAFENMCEHLPGGADQLIGVDIMKGFSFKLRELYSGKRSCFHLSSLLQAMVPALTQCRSWNFDFRKMDESLPADKVPRAMDVMLRNVKNSCHAWEENNGGISVDFRNKEYEKMLDRVAPKLLGRWKQTKED